MTNRIIADTGVIVAALDDRDGFHRWASDKFKELPKPFVTCEAVITEVCYLLRHSYKGVREALGLIDSGLISVDFSLSEEVTRVVKLMAKYEDLPMSLADACLVRMSELNSKASVFTFDSDFNIYRKHRNQSIQLISPVGFP